MSKFKNVFIASDFDGTFISKDHTFIKKNLDAVDYFIKNGGIFTIATGRPLISAKEIIEDLPINAPVIMLNGATIYDIEKKKIVFEKPVDDKCTIFMNDIMTKFPQVGCEIFTNDNIFLINESPASKDHFESANVAYELIKMQDVARPWLKISFTSHDYDLLSTVANYFAKTYGDEYQFSFSCKFLFEVTHKTARKDLSLFEITDNLGIPRKQVHTIGDNFNDLHMIKGVPISFAPENAEEEVKKSAHKVVCHHNDGAIGDMIDYLDTIY